MLPDKNVFDIPTCLIPPDWLAGWLAGWLADWLADWLTGWLTGWLASSRSLKRERCVGASDSWAGPCDAGNDMRDDNRSSDIKSPAAPTHTHTHTHTFAADYGGQLFISAYTSRVTSQNTYTHAQEQLWNDSRSSFVHEEEEEKRKQRASQRPIDTHLR